MEKYRLPEDIQEFNILEFIVRFSGFIGLGLTSRKYPIGKETVYKVVKCSIKYYICFSMASLTIGSLINCFIMMKTDNKEFIEALISFVGCLKTIMKFLVIVTHEEKLKDLLRVCVPNFFIHGEHLTESEKKIIKENLRMAKSVTKFIWIASFIGLVGILTNVSPPSAEELEKEGYVPAWKSQSRFVIPFNDGRKPYYALRVVSTEILAITVLIPMIWNIPFIFLLLTYLTTQFSTLADSLNNITTNVRDQLDTSEDKNSLQEMPLAVKETKSENENYNREMQLYLNRCCKQHQRLLEFYSKLDYVLNYNFFTDAMSTSAMLSILGFALLINSDVAQILQYMGMLVHFSMEFWCYCFIANRLSTQSTLIGEVAYSISWYQQTTAFQRQIMMVIMRAQHPVEMSAGLFGKMSLELFSKIMNTTYSYFTLMKNTIS